LLASSTFKHFEIFAMVAVIYFLISYPTAKFVEWIEFRFDIKRARPAPKVRRKLRQPAAEIAQGVAP
jgi:polar amino acid transport system permease protein